MEARGTRRFVVEGIIPERSYGVESAELKGQKSWDASDLGLSVASGTPWLDHFPIGVSGPVLIIFNEGDDDELIRRLAALGRSRGVDWRDVPIHISVTPPQLLNRRSMDEVKSEIDRVRPVLVILDPLYVSAAGGDGRSLYGMGEALTNLQQAATVAETTLYVTHHHNRDRAHSGIARMSGAGPAEWGRFLVAADVKRRERTTLGTDVLRQFTIVGSGIPDQSYMVRREIMADRSVMAVRTTVTNTTADWSDGRSPAQRRVLAALEGPERALGWREVGDRLAKDGAGSPLKKRTILEALEELTDANLVDGDVSPGVPGRWWRVQPKAGV
ncbi:MAG: AAA family ATPase [Actinomycetota bacterium]|nr:AAA family ATPase [Actinomycetota bacterium]